MRKGGALADEAYQICQEAMRGMEGDCVLYDVEFVREDDRQILRLIIDSREAVSLSDCEAVSACVDPALDMAFSYPKAYELEVRSLGFDYPLRTLEERRRHLGEWVDVRLKDAQRLVGRLVAAGEREIRLKPELNSKDLKGRRISDKKREELEKEIGLDPEAIKEMKRSLRF